MKRACQLTVGCFAKAVRLADFFGDLFFLAVRSAQGREVARFDQQHACIDADEGHLREVCQTTILDPIRSTAVIREFIATRGMHKQRGANHKDTSKCSEQTWGCDPAHRLSGRMEISAAKKAMLTKSATKTRACSFCSLMSKTQPLTSWGGQL